MIPFPNRHSSLPRRNATNGVMRGWRSRSSLFRVRVATIAFAALFAMPFTRAVIASASPTASHTVGGSGLSVRAINGAPYGVHAPIHVLTFNGSQYSTAIGLANHEIDGGLETPSSMCRSTVGCVAAVNGDFYDVTPRGKPDPGDEVGGIIQDCVLLHTPEISHQQVDLDGHLVNQGLNWSVDVGVNGVTVPITAVNQALPMRYSNVNLRLAGTLLFTAQYALQTPTATGRTTYEFIAVNSTTIPTTTVPTTTVPTTTVPTTTTPTTTVPATTSTTIVSPYVVSPTAINTTVQLQLLGQTANAVRVSPGHVDISAPTGTAFASLKVGEIVTMTTTSTSGCNNIGGHPILLDNGAVVPISPADIYMAQRYARTVIGWTQSGETIIMMVGGIDDRSGATGSQLDRLLRNLHVVTALDLDGGDSSVLYVNGHTYYHAGRAERPVSTGLLVLRNQ
jgi:hypothetical protein